LTSQPGIYGRISNSAATWKTGAEGLRYQVERLLDSVDAVCYVLDYTKLRTAEEASIFGRLKSINPDLVKRLSRRYA
jgi:hypothetical protein